MKRRDFLKAGVVGGVAAVTGAKLPGEPVQVKKGELDEKTIADLQHEMETFGEKAETITQAYIDRINEVDRKGPKVNSVIELNPDALAIARRLDKEREAGNVRGPLHGIPVLIKDNIETGDKMMTTAGSMLLEGNVASQDAFIVDRMRRAGAIILGKTNLSEWANFRSTHSSSGWSGRGGQTKNPYALDRNPCGSSSGSGAACSANLCAVAVGTETDGSIVCPSTTNGLVGIKPTVGLVSRSGIIPLSHSQDTAGPMCRTVRDAAILLDALAYRDNADPAAKAEYKGSTFYVQNLNPNGLKGRRIGVGRQFFGFNPAVDAIMGDAIRALKDAGAVIVDPVNMDTSGKYDATEYDVLLYEFKADLNQYLARLGPHIKYRTLKDLIRGNEEMKDVELKHFGQEIFIAAEEKGPLTEKKYRDALAQNHKMSREDGIDKVMDEHSVDAIIAPTGGPGWTTDHINGDHFSGGSSTPSAVSGYPAITVPAGFVKGMPVGVTFFGRKWSEPVLIKFAYAFEQATNVRQAPKFLSSTDTD